MLTTDNAVDYLLARGLVGVQSIIDGDLRVIAAARRNRNLRVVVEGGTGYLLKQPLDPAHGGHYTLANEARFYSFCQEEEIAAPVRRILPRLLHFDPEQTLLAIELLRDPQPLWTAFAPNAEARPAMARAVGTAIGLVHRTFRSAEALGHPRLQSLSRRIPWALRVHKPSPEMLAELTPANLETLKIIQKEEDLSRKLDRLAKLWREETLIHNDVKSDNILFPQPAGAWENVVLVDWELVQFGDPAWDVAGVLQDFIVFWSSSMALQDGLTPDAMVATARWPLPQLQSSLRAMWRGYRTAAGLDGDAANELLMRAVRFSAGRMIQTAYELGAAAPRLPPLSVILLQISSNLLADPEEGQVRLYGLFHDLAGAAR